MIGLKSQHKITAYLLIFTLMASLVSSNVRANDIHQTNPGNFGLPGIIDLPTARRFPDGQLIITHQNHEYLLMNGVSFQALPRLGFAFRYGGQGRGGGFAQERVNWDRSFDAHISLFDEGRYLPAISLGLRDFIGTGWYSSEYIVGTKSLGNLEVSAGFGFGRLAGRDSFSNPLGALSPKFDKRDEIKVGRGGTLGSINWFQGDASAFYGARYRVNSKTELSLEYTSDLMSKEQSYMNIKSPLNFGASYQLNHYLNLGAQYLHGSEISVTAQIAINPGQPPLLGGKELAPVPMRLRSNKAFPANQTSEALIAKVLAADQFEIHQLQIKNKSVSILVTNRKFRSVAQAVGRVASTLQRFTSNDIKFANISFISGDLKTASYQVDLEKITDEQFTPRPFKIDQPSIKAANVDITPPRNNKKRFIWGVGPYIEHRLFNPDLPLSLETGIEVEGGYRLAPGLKLSGSIRKSVLTNLTDNKRIDSGSLLPRVHSSWPKYDLAGQNGHVYELSLSYTRNLATSVYGRAHAGFLEPFFAGIGGEILYKPVNSPIGVGIDIHRVRQRAYNMKFDLLDYETTVGHLSFYYDAGGMFDLEINAGRYLAGDWGVTTTVSRKFGSGWEVGGYTTLTDVPFDTFGEGSFDKAIYISVPIDWIISSPNSTKRRLTLRPITRDGGANLSSSRRLHKQIEQYHGAEFQRAFGRLWK